MTESEGNTDNGGIYNSKDIPQRVAHNKTSNSENMKTQTETHQRAVLLTCLLDYRGT